LRTREGGELLDRDGHQLCTAGARVELVVVARPVEAGGVVVAHRHEELLRHLAGEPGLSGAVVGGDVDDLGEVLPLDEGQVERQRRVGVVDVDDAVVLVARDARGDDGHQRLLDEDAHAVPVTERPVLSAGLHQIVGLRGVAGGEVVGPAAGVQAVVDLVEPRAAQGGVLRVVGRLDVAEADALGVGDADLVEDLVGHVDLVGVAVQVHDAVGLALGERVSSGGAGRCHEAQRQQTCQDGGRYGETGELGHGSASLSGVKGRPKANAMKLYNYNKL
jgi:hypothetical protein